MDHSNLQLLLICNIDQTVTNLTPIINVNSLIFHF